MRDAAYQLQMPADRARLHALALDLLEQFYGSELGHRSDLAEELALHARWAQQGAGAELASLMARELRHLKSAARLASAQFRNADAVRLNAAVAEHGSCPQSDKAEALARAASALQLGGNHELSREMLERAEALATQSGSLSVLAGVLTKRAENARMSGAADAAMRFAGRARQAALASGDSEALGQACSSLAAVFQVTGRPAMAVQHYEQSIDAFRRCDRRQLVAIASGNLASCLQDLGETQKAEAAYRAAIDEGRRLGNPVIEGAFLGSYGSALSEVGRFEEAEASLRRALVLMKEAGISRFEGNFLLMLGNTLLSAGRSEEAEATLLQAKSVLESHDEWPEIAVVLENLSTLCAETGRASQAASYGQGALQLHRQCGNTAGEARMLAEIGRQAHNSGDFGRAVECFNQALPMLEKSCYPRAEGSARASHALLQLSLGNGLLAQEEWKRAKLLLSKAGDEHSLLRFERDIAAACAKTGTRIEC